MIHITEITNASLLPSSTPSSPVQWAQYSHDITKRYQNHRISQNYAKLHKLDIQTQSLLPSSTPSSAVLGGRVKRNEAIQPRYQEKVSKNHGISQNYARWYKLLWYSNAKSSPIFYPIVPRPRGTSETKWGNTAAKSRKGIKIIEDYHKIMQN